MTDPDGPPLEPTTAALLADSARDLYENAPCGYLSLLPDGTIARANETFLRWTGYRRADVTGRRLRDVLTVGGRIFYETHLAPLLRMQREVREIAIDFVRADRSRLPALVNVTVRSDPATGSAVVRLTVFDATDRRRYERELLQERRRAERTAARLRVLQEMVARCAAVSRQAGVVEPVVTAGRQAFDAVATSVWLLSPDAGRLVLQAGEPPDDRSPGGTQPPDIAVTDPGPEARALRERAVVVDRSPGLGGRRVAMRAVTPVVADDRALGVVSFGFPEARDPDADEVELMRTLGRQVAQALERVRLDEETRRRAWQSAFLARVGRELDEAVGFADRARRLVELLVPDVAAYAGIEVPQDGAASWFATSARPAGCGVPGQSAASGPADAPGPPDPSGPADAPAPADSEPWPDPAVVRAALAAAVRDGCAVAVPDPARPGERTGVVLPMRAREGVLGALLLVGHRARPALVDDDFLAELADRAGLALENAQLYERHRGVAQALQRSLLAGTPPVDPRFEVVTHYQSALETLEVGGDWHDTFTTARGRVGMVVGDVVGRGIPAAAAMGQVRSAVRALARAGEAPATLLGHVDDFVGTLEAGQMATLAYTELDLDTGDLRYACAGHPPPLLLAPDEEPCYLWGGRSGPVGAFTGRRPRKEDHVTLAKGSRLLLYTDGLVERRDESLDHGFARLAAHAAADPGRDLSTFVEDLTRAMLADAQNRDDVCLLALAFDPPATYRRALAADLAQLAPLRAEVREWLVGTGLDDPEQYAVVLACSEAVANAIEHGYGHDPTGVVQVDLVRWAASLEIRVRDRGTWRAPGSAPDRGRGMAIIRRLMDDLVVDRDAGTTVIMRRRLRKAARS